MSNAPTIVQWMHSFSDTTRLRMLRALEQHELTVAELCQVLQLPQSTVSRHLKLLADEKWVDSRAQGTRRLYHATIDQVGDQAAAKRFWNLVKQQLAEQPDMIADDRRLSQVIEDRQTQSQAFFASSAGQWDKMREQMFGNRFDALAIAALLDPDWVIGDLGCGTGQVAGQLAPFVRHLVAVDSSAAMLRAARRRLRGCDNVEIHKADLADLPMDDDSLDAAVLMLMLHHVDDPASVIAEVQRVLKPTGRMLIVDMTEHEHKEYQQEMGHVWLGFSEARLQRWLNDAGFEEADYVVLPTEVDAKGPPLFALRAHKLAVTEPAAA